MDLVVRNLCASKGGSVAHTPDSGAASEVVTDHS